MKQIVTTGLTNLKSSLLTNTFSNNVFFDLVSLNDWELKFNFNFKYFIMKPELLSQQNIVIIRTYEINTTSKIETLHSELDILVYPSGRWFFRLNRNVRIEDFTIEYPQKLIEYSIKNEPIITFQ